jgi:DNA-3-methyladenine glycosylase I
VQRLLGDAGIVRHRGKIESTINNAKRALQMQDEFGSLCTYFWLFEAQGGERAGPANSLAIEALQLSADLKKRGWTFVGPTTMYALMQAMGLINDHRRECSVFEKVKAARRALDP